MYVCLSVYVHVYIVGYACVLSVFCDGTVCVLEIFCV